MWYQTGTVTTVNGSASVVGVGTAWLGQVSAGDLFTIDRVAFYKVAMVGGDGSLALTTPYGGASAEDQVYGIVLNGEAAATGLLSAAATLLTPADRVTSVFGRVGAVVAQPGDYAAAQVAVAPDSPLNAVDVQGALDELSAEKAPLLSPGFSGVPTAPTPEAGDSSAKLATTAFVKAQGYITADGAPVLSVAGKTGVVTLDVADVSGAAPLASPALTGAPTAPTAAASDNSTTLATTAFVKTQTLNDLAAPTGALSINGQRLTDVADPSADQDAATKAYVDSVAQGLDAKASVRAATTGDIALSGPQTVDGVVLAAGDRALVKNQTNRAENGIYVVAAGAWVRSADANSWDELVSAYVFVEDGTVNANAGFTCTVQSGGTLGTTPVTWVQFSGAGQVIAGAGLLKDGNTLSVDTSVIAALASPAFSGTPTAPTAGATDNSTQLATTAFVKTQGYITAVQAPVLSVAGKTGVVTLDVTDIAGAAPLASPALVGIPTAPTAAAGNNTTQVATTAFVKVQGYITAAQAPVLSVAGRTGAVTLAVADVTGAAPLASPALTGAPTAPTAAAATNTTQVATTAFVKAQGYITAAQAPVLSVAGKTGVVTLAVADVAGAAPLASPTLTGSPTAPTAAIGDNSMAIATTAFVKAQGYITASGAPVLSVAGKTGVVTLLVGDVAGAAPLASPTLTGSPTAPTAAIGDNSTAIATTAFVKSQNYVTPAQLTAAGGIAWNVRSATFAAVPGNGYFVDTSAAPVTVTLPASPALGDQVRMVDAASTFGTNNLTVGRNGQLIMGLNEDMTVSTTYASVQLIFAGASYGWRLI